MNEPVRTLVDSLIAEMARVRDEVMPAYLAVGNAGQVALVLMRRDLDAAARALSEHNATECLRLHKALTEWDT